MMSKHHVIFVRVRQERRLYLAKESLSPVGWHCNVHLCICFSYFPWGSDHHNLLKFQSLPGSCLYTVLFLLPFLFDFSSQKPSATTTLIYFGCGLPKLVPFISRFYYFENSHLDFIFLVPFSSFPPFFLNIILNF